MMLPSPPSSQETSSEKAMAEQQAQSIKYDYHKYSITGSGTNSKGNHYCNREYESISKPTTTGYGYYYSNQDGSYCYKNPDGTNYYNDGQGFARYTKADGSGWEELRVRQEFTAADRVAARSGLTSTATGSVAATSSTSSDAGYGVLTPTSSQSTTGSDAGQTSSVTDYEGSGYYTDGW